MKAGGDAYLCCRVQQGVFRGYGKEEEMARICFLALLVGVCTSGRAAIIQFGDFSNTQGLQLNGEAVAVSATEGRVLRLTPSDPSLKRGSVFWENAVDVTVFNSFFTFTITTPKIGPKDPDGEQGADGFAFVLQSGVDGPASLGSVGDGLAYKGVQPSAAVEFDIWRNVSDAPNHDPSSNHLGILVNGVVDHGAGSPWTAHVASPFDDAGLWYAWVDYDGRTLDVRVNQTGVYPAQPNLSRLLDLSSILGQPTAYVGFAAATGSGLAEQRLVSWTYVPEPASMTMLLILMVAMRHVRHRPRPA
jgi:hypothetical protein